MNPFRSKTPVDQPVTKVSDSEKLFLEQSLAPIRVLQGVLFVVFFFFLTLLTRAYLQQDMSALWLVTPTIGTILAYVILALAGNKRHRGIMVYFSQEDGKA